MSGYVAREVLDARFEVGVARLGVVAGSVAVLELGRAGRVHAGYFYPIGVVGAVARAVGVEQGDADLDAEDLDFGVTVRPK